MVKIELNPEDLITLIEKVDQLKEKMSKDSLLRLGPNQEED